MLKKQKCIKTCLTLDSFVADFGGGRCSVSKNQEGHNGIHGQRRSGCCQADVRSAASHRKTTPSRGGHDRSEYLKGNAGLSESLFTFYHVCFVKNNNT